MDAINNLHESRQRKKITKMYSKPIIEPKKPASPDDILDRLRRRGRFHDPLALAFRDGVF